MREGGKLKRGLKTGKKAENKENILKMLLSSCEIIILDDMHASGRKVHKFCSGSLSDEVSKELNPSGDIMFFVL